MKHLLIVLIALVLSSCCSTKKVVENAPKSKNKAIAQVATQEVVKEKTQSNQEGKDIVLKKKTKDTSEENVSQQEKTQTLEPKKATKEKFANQELKKRVLTSHQLWDDLLKKHVSDNGNVNYNGFKKDHSKLLGYIKILQASMPNKDTSKEDKLAYWMNAYNAMTVDLIIRNYPVKSIKDIDKPWNQRLWKLGKKWYNLDEIEHKILRKMDEPRIHFGIVCASFSCPKLINKAFTASNLDQQLTEATRAFLADTNHNSISENNVKLSKIFKWFAKDFKENGSLIDFLNKYSDTTISPNAKKSFKDYNWSLNE